VLIAQLKLIRKDPEYFVSLAVLIMLLFDVLIDV
jgi:hypothetical protein